MTLGKKDKLRARFLSRPKDFTWDELEAVLKCFDYCLMTKGKTAGSRRAFFRERDKDIIYLHEPHSPNIVKICYIDQIIDKLRENGDLNE